MIRTTCEARSTSYKYDEVKDDQRQHFRSQVLTGAMFDIIRRLTAYNMKVRGRSAKEALWFTIRRMQCMAVQPLDLLPPVDVTFEDYALAVLRAEQIVNPTDPDGYRNMMIDVFVDRGILSDAHATELRKPATVFDRLDVAVFHDPQSIAASRANAYRFLDDNRRNLFIPFAADVVVTDLSTAQKLTVAARRLPRQLLLQYVWREDVRLEGRAVRPLRRSDDQHALRRDPGARYRWQLPRLGDGSPEPCRSSRAPASARLRKRRPKPAGSGAKPSLMRWPRASPLAASATALRAEPRASCKSRLRR